MREYTKSSIYQRIISGLLAAAIGTSSCTSSDKKENHTLSQEVVGGAVGSYVVITGGLERNARILAEHQEQLTALEAERFEAYPSSMRLFLKTYNPARSLESYNMAFEGTSRAIINDRKIFPELELLVKVWEGRSKALAAIAVVGGSLLFLKYLKDQKDDPELAPIKPLFGYNLPMLGFNMCEDGRMRDDPWVGHLCTPENKLSRPHSPTTCAEIVGNDILTGKVLHLTPVSCKILNQGQVIIKYQ